MLQLSEPNYVDSMITAYENGEETLTPKEIQGQIDSVFFAVIPILFRLHKNHFSAFRNRDSILLLQLFPFSFT